MATRVVRNDFVAGEISPALWGREDQELYFHGAAKLENFIPMQTGGIRKRAGTELVWHLSQSGSTEYRVIPYLYDKDAWGLLALYRAAGQSGNVKCRFLAHKADGTEATTTEATVSQITLSASESLSGIRYQQIGDTLFLTLHGHQASMCRVTFATPSLVWSQVISNEKPVKAPALQATAHNFHEAGSEGYVEGFRKYRLWGVKNGVLSDPSETRVSITLKWISGAYIDVTFTPNWGQHDYYILGKLLGGQYGEVARFYPDRTAGAKGDMTWTAVSASASGTIDGTTYTAATSDPSSLWKSTDPDTIQNGIHKCGTFCTAATGTYKKASAQILSVLVWFGAKMKYTPSGGTETVGDAGMSTQVVARLRKGGTTGTVAAEWTITPQYGDSSQTLMVDSPSSATNGQWSLTFHDPTTGDAAAVPMRGIVLCSDTSSLSYHDDNISPGSIAGQQDAILVGDTGMDVDIISTWQQRLVAASSQTHPFTMWFSTVGDLYNFHTYRPQNSDDAFEATLAVTRASRILHVATEKLFLVFTESGEFTVDSSNGFFAFNTINIRKCSGIGAHPDVPPAITEGDILFVANDARSLYQMRYRLDEDSVRPTCLTHRAAHLTETHRIRAMAYQAHPDSVLWCLLEDGSFASLTFSPDEQVVAWARHRLAGGGGLVAEDVFATGSIRVNAETDTTNDVFIVLRDTGTGGDVWVERMRPCIVSDEPEIDDARCADHIGYEVSDFPAGGDPESAVEATLETLRMDRGENAMAAQTNSFDSVLRIRRSGAVSVRPAGAGDKVPWSGTATQPDALPRESDGRVALVRRDVRVSPRAFQNRDNRLEIKSADEWPCEILALEAAVHFGDTRRT